MAGRPVADSSPTDPIALHHEAITRLSLTMTNRSEQPVTVAHVRLEGAVLDLIFLTYDTGVRQQLQPGETRSIAFDLDFFDLDGQAHGLLRSQVRLYDPDRRPLGQQSLILDGRGSPFATMAVFTLALAALAATSITWNFVRLAQRRLPRNAFVRGTRFLHSGAALGLAVSAACSTLRIWPLPTTTWVMVTVVGALVAFALGYLSPGADDETDLVIDLAGSERAEPAAVDPGGLNLRLRSLGPPGP